jgi:hypothetical protein
MDVEATDQLAVDCVAELGGHLLVAADGHDRLAGPARKRVGSGSVDPNAFGRAPRGELASQPPQRSAHFLRASDDRRRDLDDALEELGLHALRRLADDTRKGRCRVERLGVDENELLLHTERPRRRGAEARVDQDLPRIPCTGRPAASHA